MIRRSEAPDLAVDELKRRARRRLVGAIVLALGAAVLLPLLLESEPKPLGDEVSIQIPPIDNGKFVNPLSPEQAGSIKGRGAEQGVKNAAPTSESPAATAATQAAPAAPSSEEKRSETGSAAPADTPPAPPATTPASTPAPAAPSVPEAKKEAPPEPKANAKQSDAAPAASGFVVQVAAFTDRYGAQAQARKLKHAGFPAYVESVPSGASELQRVRVGPYSSRDAADAARAKLKAAGYDAIVARTR